MRRAAALFLVFSVLVLLGNLYAKERRGANIEVYKEKPKIEETPWETPDLKGELIAVKENSLLLLDPEGADVAANINQIYAIKIVKKSKASGRALIASLIGGFGGALLGYYAAGNYPRGRVAGIYGVIGVGLGFLLAYGLTSETKEKEEFIQIEGKSDSEIQKIMHDLRSKARVKDFQ